MNDSISLTIPRIAGDLRCAAHYLNALAEGLDSQPATPDSPATVSNSEEIAKAAGQAIETAQAPEPPAPPAPTVTEPNPATAFGGAGDAAPAPPAPTTEEPEPPAANPPAGVDVDSDGLPWDERIHAGSRKKLAKTQQWKKKRGVSDEVIAQVEAELRQVMAIPAAAPATEQPAAPQPPATTKAPDAPAPPPTATPATDFTGWGWQEFMGEFMKRAMTHDQATEACKAHGIDSTAVLATRPDLIPQVAATLFGG